MEQNLLNSEPVVTGTMSYADSTLKDNIISPTVCVGSN